MSGPASAAKIQTQVTEVIRIKERMSLRIAICRLQTPSGALYLNHIADRCAVVYGGGANSFPNAYPSFVSACYSVVREHLSDEELQNWITRYYSDGGGWSSAGDPGAVEGVQPGGQRGSGRRPAGGVRSP